jgi:hypothetical protein
MEPIFLESTFAELYASAVAAFPLTTRRQYATQPIVIDRLQIIPFLGMHTLFLKAEAINEGRHHSPMILVKGIQYSPELVPGTIEVTASDGQNVRFHRPGLEHNDILVRCDCGDFAWRFNYYNHLDKSLYGTKRKKYEAMQNPGSANPLQLPGCCKHILKFVQVLHESGWFN